MNIIFVISLSLFGYAPGSGVVDCKKFINRQHLLENTRNVKFQLQSVADIIKLQRHSVNLYMALTHGDGTYTYIVVDPGVA